MEDKKLQNLLKKYNKSENYLYVFAPKCNPEIRQNFTTFYKDHGIGLQKPQIRSFKAVYAITEACNRVIERKLKLTL